MIQKTVYVLVLALWGLLPNESYAQQGSESSKYRVDYDFPAGVLHGTWDFDEWPGIDHHAVYREHYLYESSDGEKIKIDFNQTLFDENDHEGYLKNPQQLLDRGKKDLVDMLENTTPGTLLGVFTHPDDDILLSGGLLAYAAGKGWDVRVVLVSNGADGSRGASTDSDESLSGYNAFGVLPDGKFVAVTDSMGLFKQEVVQQYSNVLGVQTTILPVKLDLDGKIVVQLGEYPGLDWEKSFGPGSRAREEMKRALTTMINDIQPSLVITNGTNGEYGNYLHKTVHVVVLEAARNHRNNATVLTAFPEYNSSDTITHFLDLDLESRKYRNLKYSAFRELTFIHTPGLDYDKPWDPTDELPDGAFVKDYGYSPIEGYPPRYEFYHLSTSPEE